VNLIAGWRSRWTLTACLGLGALAWASPAVAQDETQAATSEQEPEEESQAANLFALAESAFSSRDYERAAHLFLRADEKAPHASVMYNAAVSWDYAGKRAQAADCYQTALERAGLTPRQQAQSEQRIDELGKYLGLVHVAKPVGGLASIDRIQQRVIPFQFFQEPGSYHVELETVEGAKTATDITVLPGQTLRLELNPVESTITASPVIVPKPDPEQSTPFKPVPELPRDESPSSAQEVIGWIGIGLGVVAAGASIYWGVQTEKKKDDYLASGKRDADLYNDGRELRTRTNIGWVSSAVVGATGLTLVLTSPTVRF
jgi:hypothetical protein